jgi:hypothetical protein
VITDNIRNWHWWYFGYGWWKEEATACLAWVCDIEKEVMSLNAEMNPVERLLPWQQHAVSRSRITTKIFVLIGLAAHPLDQTK